MEEKSLSLIVKEKTLGVLVTNAKDIKSFVQDKLATYSVDNYLGDYQQAAKDKAELNNAAKQLNDERIQLEKEWLLPFNEFKGIVTDTVNLIKDASGKLDVVVKAKEQEEKDAKYALIKNIWEEQKFTLVSLDRVFNQKWLNKTTKMTTVETEIKEEIQTIQKDLDALDSFGEDTAQLKELYLSNLNLQITLQKGAELKANREKLAAMKLEQEKQAQEAAEAVEEAAAESEPVEETPAEETPAEDIGKENSTNEVSEQKNTEKHFSASYVFNIVGSEVTVKQIIDIAKSSGLSILPSITLSATTEQIQQLKSSMEKNGIIYEKMNFLTLKVN
jgi:hypothetical protein